MAIVIPYTKQTWTDSSGGDTPISAARLGVIEEGILDVSLAPAVRVFHNAAQSIGTAANTALAFNSERFDQAGGAAAAHHDTATNNTRLTALYAGIYAIFGTFEFANNTTNQRAAFIRLNGATMIAQQSQQATGGALTTGFAISTIYSLSVNDYVELIAFQNSGGNLNVNSSGNYSPEFGMARVG